ncbi:hypothetical protein QJS10_CPB04g00405 [Acorus calamus]|uniref:Disease resistance protein winged helix domain-containing protein n=1 Tax=Acorus calamus TaxID=4465 RepID=A0AAV9EWN3_ACOCL|nr:hypothetical protein QJS10_CPB04g00405 [Acorus calamus]
MEETGSEYLNELCQRSFMQCLESNGRNGQSIYTMHNVIHDMAQMVAGEECRTVTLSESCRVPENALHASLLCDVVFSSGTPTADTETKVLKPFFKAKCLRSLILVGVPIHELTHVPQKLVNNLCRFTRLYTLDLSNANPRKTIFYR